MRQIILAASFAMALPGLAFAQSGGMRIEEGQIRAKQLMDRDVYSTDNKEIGEVEDLVIDTASGRIVTTVVEVEGRLGMTDKYVSVPLNRLSLKPGERRVTIDMTEEQVKSLPGIDYRD
ncbi:PRC-barrel domain-containing protein [Roseomonas sp. KE0001]|uniref:PRC-barrel domain-containing protein n=1 Tax=unclassified Roseomonas TaxID=2617492 RepID=UPI0018E03A3E|nr:PRC-barrel domain-containing protein [Roseomonas sp. KE0001]MBI0432907.1 PRC-barrel domain containing protein [Roseomonas sp. KE0001]